MSKSLFLEGTDGSGKSTQFQLLKKYFEENKVPYIALREPGGSDYYEALRSFFQQAAYDHPPVSDALLSAAGRAANISATRKALKEGKWVISDRAYPSSYVYQAVQGVKPDDIRAINNFALDGFTYDIKILLDTPVEVAAERINASGAKKDYWESQGSEFFTTIREKYLELAKEENFTIIDASASIEEVHQQIIKAIENAL